jgi:hypothetical protein
MGFPAWILFILSLCGSPPHSPGNPGHDPGHGHAGAPLPTIGSGILPVLALGSVFVVMMKRRRNATSKI